MSILDDFDAAIAESEELPKGYVIGERTYGSYLRNDAWKSYLAAMPEEYRIQYGNGSGGELEEKNGRPPKMASFASSSRLIYCCTMGKNGETPVSGFKFEEHLPTVIGGIANMDGYLETDDCCVFVEAKCREPYGHKSPEKIKQNYKPLYEYLQEKLPDLFSCSMEDIPDTRDMLVSFRYAGKESVHFDIKQMLCHLLGVANRMLTEEKHETPILFLYLLYNPTALDLPRKSRGKILDIYADTCAAAEGYCFKMLFGCVVDFLLGNKTYSIDPAKAERIKENFSFVLCDQNSYRSYL